MNEKININENKSIPCEIDFAHVDIKKIKERAQEESTEIKITCQQNRRMNIFLQWDPDTSNKYAHLDSEMLIHELIDCDDDEYDEVTSALQGKLGWWDSYFIILWLINEAQNLLNTWNKNLRNEIINTTHFIEEISWRIDLTWVAYLVKENSILSTDNTWDVQSIDTISSRIWELVNNADLINKNIAVFQSEITHLSPVDIMKIINHIKVHPPYLWNLDKVNYETDIDQFLKLITHG